MDFATEFQELTSHPPFPWQTKLFEKFMQIDIPAVCNIPTGLGKTSIIPIWMIARRHGASLPRRLVYVVNRRTVVDQTTAEMEGIRRTLEAKNDGEHISISTLRGQFADNREWSRDPSRPAIICGTVDMIGSRLLFSGYRIGFKSKPMHAGFLGQDAFIVHDEAHLEPAFQKIIEAIQTEQLNHECTDQLPWPKIRVMAMSATPRHSAENVFSLAAADKEHQVIKRRINARKVISLHSAADPGEVIKKVLDIAESYHPFGQNILIFLRTVEAVERVVSQLPEPATEQLTGTLRGLERDNLLHSNIFQRFLPRSSKETNIEADEGTAFLVCTSAGEVGVNISADHLICDLATFDSMIQRFGRVNRFGDHNDSRVDVVYCEEFGTDEYDQRRQRTLKLLRQLGGDGCPAAIDVLDIHTSQNAFAPAPKILPASEILFDAWALTSICEQMPGRPPVEPYLHGVSEWEPPQTQVAWREEVNVITGDLLDQHAPAELLADYPLKPQEILRDRSDRVFKHLATIAGNHPHSPAWLISGAGAVRVMTLDEVADKKRKTQINGQTILLPPSAGGLKNGLLNSRSPAANDVADIDGERKRVWGDVPAEGMMLIRSIDADPRDEVTRYWRWYVTPFNAEGAGRSSIRPITLDHHTRDVVARSNYLATALQLPVEFTQALEVAAELHDRGKQRELWQRSIGNPNPTNWLAKSGGRSAFRTSYRHEFGSLSDSGIDPAFCQLTEEMQDLVLHLIAAHHGRGRPHFFADETFDPLPGIDAISQQHAIETPHRFDRLQRRYGRWGLAFLESLLRAADWEASAEPSEDVTQ